MATWKKVIVSGSNADLAQITSSVGIDTLSTRTDQHIAITGSATSTASFGAYIGDGSQLTGVGMDIQRVYYVSPSGNDSTGVGGSLNYPFQTISGSVVQAKADAAAGSYHVSSSVINVMPGHYFEQDLQMDGGTYYFHPGAILSPPVQAEADVKPLFTISDAVKNLKILGQGQFIIPNANDEGGNGNNSRLISSISGESGSVRFEFDQIEVHNAMIAFTDGAHHVNMVGNSIRVLGNDNNTNYTIVSRGSKDNHVSIQANDILISGSNEFVRYGFQGPGSFALDANTVKQHTGFGIAGYAPRSEAYAEVEFNKWELVEDATALAYVGNTSAQSIPHHLTLTGDVYLNTTNTTAMLPSSKYSGQVGGGVLLGALNFNSSLNFGSSNLQFEFLGSVYNKSNAIPFFVPNVTNNDHSNNNVIINGSIDNSGSLAPIKIGGAGNSNQYIINASINNESGHGLITEQTAAKSIFIDNSTIITDHATITPLAISGSAASPGKVNVRGILSSNRALGANINLTGSGIFTNDTDAAQIVNASIKSSHDGGSTFTALSANPYTASFGRFEGFSASFAHMTVSGDSLLEDVITTGITKLGNDMSDKAEVTGSLNVTGSSTFTGSVHIHAADGTSNRGIQVNIQQEGITNDSNDSIVLRPGPEGSSGEANIVMLPDESRGNYIVTKLGITGGSRYGFLQIRGNNVNDIYFQASENGASYHKGSLNIGGTSTTVGPKLDVTGNIRVSTGITGSYLTDNKLLTAGSVGQIESSAITWDDTTLTVGSSGAGHVYATQVTASEVKISSLAADRIVFVNSENQLEDSTNLQYDDDGGLNVGAKLSLTGDLIVSHNLTVQGTASFQSTEDLDVKDRFIRMASGSTSTGDGGFAVQQTGPLDTEGFGYDSALQRWGVTSSFDASQNALDPAAFLPMTINGTENVPTSNQVANETRYKKAGNMYIDTNATSEEGGVWIYV